MNPTRALVESALLVALAVVLFLASHLLPFLGVVVTLLCPAPLVILGLRHNLRRALAGMGVAAFLVAAFLGPVSALFFALGFGVLGVGIGWLARRYRSGVEIMLYGILVSLGSKLLLMLLITKITGLNPFSVDPGEMQQVLDRMLASAGGWAASSEAVAAFRAQMEQTLGILPLVFPSLLVVAAGMDCWLSYVVSNLVVRRLGMPGMPELPSFSEWRFPRSIFCALLASVLLLFLSKAAEQTGFASERVRQGAFRMGLNLRVLVSMLFFAQGASVAMAWLHHKGVGLLRYGLLALLLFVPFLSQLCLLLGMADMWLDVRTRFRR